MNESKMRPVEISKLTQTVKTLSMEGKVKITANGFSYLDIDDNFIHKIYPLINQNQITKPDYFNADTYFIGAHITITYPEEDTNISELDAGKLLSFEIEGMFTAYLFGKKYYLLKVKSPAILKIRAKYGLPDKLTFKGHLIDLHITVAVQEAF